MSHATGFDGTSKVWSNRPLPGYQVPSFDPNDAPDIVRRVPRLTRWILRLMRRSINTYIANPVITRAYQRGIISSAQLHVLLTQFDPTQKGVSALL